MIATRRARPRQRFLNSLRAVFDSEPLEDGMDHPAERLIGAALESEDWSTALGWIQGARFDSGNPAFATSVLLCIARRPRLGDATRRAEVLRRAFADDDVTMRDAAAQAAETWGDAGLRRVLRTHTDPVTMARRLRSGRRGRPRRVSRSNRPAK